MSFVLHVDGERWRAGHDRFVAEHTGIVPVVKGNGYGFGRDLLCAEAARLGVSMIAVGAYTEVPEARALIPVPEAGRKQTGTIIVSVTDAVFSVDNPEHVEIANRIEIRLVDQDLLPRYADI